MRPMHGTQLEGEGRGGKQGEQSMQPSIFPLLFLCGKEQSFFVNVNILLTFIFKIFFLVIGLLVYCFIRGVIAYF